MRTRPRDVILRFYAYLDEFTIKRYDIILIFLIFRYRELEETDPIVVWLWNILELFSPEERVLFVRFVSGRSRLPANLADLSQRFQV